MIRPGTYTTRNGRAAKVYAIEFDEDAKCHVAIGATFSPKGMFLGAESWRADNGQFFMSGHPCTMDIVLSVASPSQAA